MSYPPKGRADYLQLGDWNAYCAECGRKRKASEMKKLPPGVPGSGLFTCPEHWDARQPQDFVRGVPDRESPPWVQPLPDSFTTFCTYEGISCLADLAVAGCSICDYLPPGLTPVIDIDPLTTESDVILTTEEGEELIA